MKWQLCFFPSGLRINNINHPDEFGIIDEPFTLICNKSTNDPVSWWYSDSPDGTNPVYISLGGTLSNDYMDRFQLDGDNLAFDMLQANDTGYYICLENAGYGDRHVTYLFVAGNFTPVLFN